MVGAAHGEVLGLLECGASDCSFHRGLLVGGRAARGGTKVEMEFQTRNHRRVVFRPRGGSESVTDLEPTWSFSVVRGWIRSRSRIR